MDILPSFSKSLTDIVLFIYFSNAKIIPEVSSPPDQSVEDWLTWTKAKLEAQLSENPNKIAALMGINRGGGVQYLYMPIIIPRAFGTTDKNASAAIIGNMSAAHSKPSFIYTDSSEFNLAFVIKTFSSISEEICPEVALSDKFLANTS
jgi:hypothetical protein